MPNRKVTTALIIGVAGIFALSAGTSAFAKTKHPGEFLRNDGSQGRRSAGTRLCDVALPARYVLEGQQCR